MADDPDKAPAAPEEEPAAEQVWQRVEPPPGQEPDVMAIMTLIAGIVSLFVIFIPLLGWLVALAAISMGITRFASSQQMEDGAKVMAAVGIALAGLALLALIWSLLFWGTVYVEGSSYEGGGGGGSSTEVDTGGGSGGSGGGGSGGGSGGGGGSAGGGGGGSGGGIDGGVGAPWPGGLIALALLAVAWRRR